MKKRLLSLLLAVLMIVSLLPTAAFAAPLNYVKPAAESEPAKVTGTWNMDAEGKWSFRSQDGAAKDGWYYLNTTNKATDYNWFYFTNGVMNTGWVQDKTDASVWYYTGETKDSSEGGLVKGWATDPRDGKKYYLDPSTGIMCYGWKQISGTWYYFGEKQYSNASHPYGSMYANERTPDGYYVGSGGTWIPNYSESHASDTSVVRVTGVSLDKSEVEMTVGDTCTLNASVAPANATNRNVTWSSSDSTVATVDAAGKVTAVAAGTAVITVTTVDGGKTATCTVTVTAPTPETYTVRFDMQGHGTQIDPQTNVASGSTISAPAAPTATGYTFDGWYKEAGCTTAWDFANDPVTADTTLYAKWTQNPPTPAPTPVEAPVAATGLIYNGTEQTGVAQDTGYTVTNGKATDAGTFTATAALAEGYKWSDGTTAAKQIEWSIAKKTLTATADDKNVTVGDDAPTYTVTYTGWVNGESIDTVTPTTAAILACEYTAASAAGEYAITFTTEPTFANYSVTAVPGKLTAVSPAPTTYTVTINAAPDGYGTVDKTTVENVPSGTQISTSGNTITLNGITVTATPATATAQYTYVFDSWTNGTATVIDNITVTASFTRTTNKYTVTWKSQDGSVTLETDNDVEYDTHPSYNGENPAKSEDGCYTYAFAGWADSANQETGRSAGSLENVTGNKTYYAAFSKTGKTYTITYKDKGGSDFTGTHGTDFPETHTYGTTTPLVDPTKVGYYFGGWYIDSSCSGDPLTTIGATDFKNDITLYAKWMEKITLGEIISTYGTLFPTTRDSAWINIKQSYICLAYRSVQYPLNLSIGDGGAIYFAASSSARENDDGNYLLINYPIELVISDGKISEIIVNYPDDKDRAKYNGTYAPAEYTVTFDLNGITGTAPTAQTIEKDGKVTKPADPTDAIHTFAGWYKTKDANTGMLSDPWDFDNDTVTANMTLYAKWTRTLESIYTNSDIPKAENNTAPDNAWKNGDGGKAFIAHSTGNAVLYLYKQLQPSGAKQLSCRKTENFTKIGDDYVLFYELSGKQYGVYTLHMTDSKFTSVTYNGEGTDYEVLSGTYTAPTTKGLTVSRPQLIESIIGDSIPELASPADAVYDAWESDGSAWCYIFEDEENAGEKFLVFDDLNNSIPVSLKKKTAVKVQDEDLLENEEIYKHESEDYIIYFYFMDRELDSVEFVDKGNAFSAYVGIYKAPEIISEEDEIKEIEENIETKDDSDIPNEEPKENTESKGSIPPVETVVEETAEKTGSKESDEKKSEDQILPAEAVSDKSIEGSEQDTPETTD